MIGKGKEKGVFSHENFPQMNSRGGFEKGNKTFFMWTIIAEK